MENERMYLISEDTYRKHIDEKVHLYSLLRQLAFCAEKVSSPLDAEHLEETAILYGRTAEEMFENWNIPGRYLVYGDTDDLRPLMELELEPVDMAEDIDIIFDMEDAPCDSCVDDFCETLSDLLSRVGSLLSGLEDIIAEFGELAGE
jgi:hypothetical protein